jgi:hypothetical protein
VFDGTTAPYPVPLKDLPYAKGDLAGYGKGKAVRGSATVSYKVVSFLYFRLGLTYWRNFPGFSVKSYVGNESVHSDFRKMNTVIINAGFSFSVR